tara:strand:+ start:2157 stop:2423 length:267 start_codon:yes stop_codon:yes gene_type:complete
MKELRKKRKYTKRLSTVPSDVQVAGSHYKDMPIQPAEFSQRNGLSFLAGCVVKRVSRCEKKNDGSDFLVDLTKAKHEIDLIIEFKSKK